MTLGVARLGDKTIGTCRCHNKKRKVSGTIVTASEDTFANNRGVARLGDKVLASCGHVGYIVSASNDTFTNNLGTARLGDKTEGCYRATIITASEDTFTN